jgi:hypothetical protein
MDFCKYKDFLGVPGKGIHSYRLFGFALADIVMTIIGAYILSLLFGWTYWKTLLGLFLLGIALHRLFCVKTTLDKILFPTAD